MLTKELCMSMVSPLEPTFCVLISIYESFFLWLGPMEEDFAEDFAKDFAEDLVMDLEEWLLLVARGFFLCELINELLLVDSFIMEFYAVGRRKEEN